jgi:hypothetical protein
MSPIARLPIFLALAGKRAMLAGGSSAAAWKAELLSAAGAHVDVYAEEVSAELRALADAPPRGSIMLHRRAWTAGDVETAAVAVGAFADDADAARFAQAARKAGVPVNSSTNRYSATSPSARSSIARPWSLEFPPTVPRLSSPKPSAAGWRCCCPRALRPGPRLRSIGVRPSRPQS